MSMIAQMQQVIRLNRERIARLQAGDYSDYRYCTGEEAARYIACRYQSAIDAAQRVIDANIKPEDLA